MILLLDTSTPVCRLILQDGDQCYQSEWQADRALAKHLLAYLRDQLALHQSSLDRLAGIGVFKGPGSFTGLRIGMTVANTLADQLQVPIVGAVGDSWQSAALADLSVGKNDKLVLPFYGREANITIPRK